MTCPDDPKGEKRSADVIGGAVLVATTAASVSALEHVCGKLSELKPLLVCPGVERGDPRPEFRGARDG